MDEKEFQIRSEIYLRRHGDDQASRWYLEKDRASAEDWLRSEGEEWPEDEAEVQKRLSEQ